MEFRLLGPFEVWDGDYSVEIAGAKRRALLALLVLRANEVVRSELLIDELWGERPPRNAASALQTHVSRLRKTLGADTIASREWGYVLRAAPEEIDLLRFESQVAEAEPLAARQRATKLAEALALWRGPPLADLVNEPALHDDIARLEELRLSTLERRIDADLEAGRSTSVVGELEALVARQPLREHLRWLLILALYRAGRQAEALEVYRETRRVLTEELGLEPSPALKELEQAILRQDPSLDANEELAHVEPPAEELESKRRRVPAVALLALLALGLAGTATAVALVRPERGTSSGTETEPIFQTLPTTPANPPTDIHPPTSEPKTTPVKNHPTAPPAHPSSHPSSTTAKHGSSTQATTTVTRTSQRVSPPQKTVTITDDFASGNVDPTIWNVWTDASGVSIADQGGQVQLTVSANAVRGGQYNQIDGSVATRCTFPGNFDARVDYTLLEWPTGDNIFVGLDTYYPGRGMGVGRDNNSQWGDQYTSAVGQSYHAVGLPDKSGSLRIVRRSGIETESFLYRGSWHPLSTGVERGSASIALALNSDAGDDTFGGQELKIAFDNFKVTGVNPVCP